MNTNMISAGVQNTSEQQAAEARAQFEAWAKENHYSLRKWSGDYTALITDHAWLGYQAAVAGRLPVIDQHPDDLAVDAFAAAMKAKMAEARAKGRGGWEDPAQCSANDLSRMLRDHVEKGDPRDVANFCMMLHQRGEAIVVHQPAGQEPVASVEFSNGTAIELLFTGQAMPDGQHDLYATPPAQAVDLLPVVKLAYGLLWMTSDDPSTSTLGTLPPHVSVNRARTLLRDAMTNEQRGEGIASARSLIDSQAVQ